jgi:hypothetical protein
MPFLNRPRIRGWLDDHNWSYQRLADACLEIDPADKMSSEVVRNAVMGHDPIRPGRVRLIEKVTQKAGDPIPYSELVAEEKKEEDEGPKEETTAPPRRDDKTTGPKRVRGQGAAA